MKNCEYWIWLQRTLGFATKIDDFINYYGSARELYEAGSYEWRISGLFSKKQIESLSKFSPSQSGDIMRACSDNHWDIITPDDMEYPLLLREIYDFPAVLYVDGDASILAESRFIAMVGTRNASNYGLKAAGIISTELSKSGLVVVSGGALGIDSASHLGALNSGHKTVAVLGCGLGTDYLRENEALRNDITKNGALVTEYPPFYSASRFTFPQRNRIISGISLGTVVIEAGERSGSLITARLAMEQNRDVFAVPGDVFSTSFTGANKMIQDGAKPLFTAADVVGEYHNLYPNEIKIEGMDAPLSNFLKENDDINKEAVKVKRNNKEKSTKEENKPTEIESQTKELKPLPQTISENAKLIYQAIDGETEFDTIVSKSGLPVFKVMSSISELEISGVIESLPGRKYKKN